MRVFVVTALFLIGPATQASAQLLPWFNGAGASIGGGPMTFRGHTDDPLTGLIRPEEQTSGAVSGAVFVSLSKGRWAVLLPEIGFQSGWGKTAQLTGTLTRDSTTVAIEPTDTYTSVYDVVVSAQYALVPNGRIWVRGGVGGGWISGSLSSDDQRISILIDGGSGLALTAATGASVYTHHFTDYRLSVDAEVHYLRINADGLTITLPSFRFGIRWMPD